MTSDRLTIFLGISMIILLTAEASVAAEVLSVEAESGTLGTNFLVGNSSGTIYISNTNNNSSTTVPSIPGRVASYSITFPAEGTYDLYARVRVGAGAANDDSLFYGNGFGAKAPANAADWILCNNLAGVGFTSSGDIVTGGGSAGTGVWKWINLSQFNGGEAPVNYTVAAGNLTQTFQIGGREDGFDIDKFVFGTTGTSFAVSNLDNGTVPPPPPPITNYFNGPDGIAFHRFSPVANGINADGANPAAGLVVVGGALCGTTLNGGLRGAGTAFSMSFDGTNFSAFRSFTNAPDAGNPKADLVVSGDGFFGTTIGGGASGVGALVVGQTNGSVTVLRSFSVLSPHTATNSGGASPSALVVLSGGRLYGTTTIGGTAGNGTVFSATTNGSTFSVLHDFSLLDAQAGTNSDGAVPWGGLILSGDTLYGTTSSGGAGGFGTVFSVKTNGSNFATLYSFTAQDPVTWTNADGAMPCGGLVLRNGMLYGTAAAGGFGNGGVVFALRADGSNFSVLHHFASVDSITKTNVDGSAPVANLFAVGATLFGTASAGGSGASGSVFAVRTNGSEFQIVYSFSAVESGSGTNADGARPVGGLTLAGTSLYGTTFAGGPGAAGTVFSLPFPITPAVITSIANNYDGSVTLFFQGTPNSTNVIQSATGVGASVLWQDVSTNVADLAGSWQFTDPAASFPAQFYRSFSR